MKNQKTTDKEFILSLLVLVLSSYIVSDFLDKRETPKISKGSVDVVLEPVPVEEVTSSVPSLYNSNQRISVTEKELDCLSRNIYFEAAHEPYIGKIAVAHVTYNRVLDKRWGDSFCGVVYEPKQFSWTNNPKLRNSIPSGRKWVSSQHAARMFIRGVRVKNFENVNHYYANYIKPPEWSRGMARVGVVSKHLFYVGKSEN